MQPHARGLARRRSAGGRTAWQGARANARRLDPSCLTTAPWLTAHTAVPLLPDLRTPLDRPRGSHRARRRDASLIEPLNAEYGPNTHRPR